MPQIRKALLVAALFLALAILSRSLANAATLTTPVWLGSGVTFAALLVSSRWWWPAILAGAAGASLVWAWAAHGLGLGGGLAFAGLEVVCMASGAWIARLGGHDPDRRAGAMLLIAGALFAAALGGLLAMPMWQWLRPGANLLEEGRAWTFSTAIGLLLLAPVATAFRGFRIRRSGGMPMPQFLAGGLAFLAFLLATALVFADNIEQRYGHVAATLAYLPMPFLLASAALWGARGGALAMLLGSLLIIGRSAHGGGPFAVAEGFPGEAVVEAQAFVAIWTGVMIMVRALARDRWLALDQARDWRLRYERTMRALRVASVEYDAVTGQAVWGEGVQLGTGIGSLEEWLERIDPAERGLAQAVWSDVAQGIAPESEQSYTLRLDDGRRLRVREHLAGIRGADGKVEQVVAMLRAEAIDD
ncbi:MASE1 domain-containing protein [Chromobacterium sphagni]|uniref:MASE1 domain-containing protein n=1 Tax=Chromobacterium sphagni TaxID=1903179 RepID=A0ABX3C8R6_9NEIS|nr:MASE1 domain-containing protein [Chromobacterium sphagni]OHX17519.1 hypothetical protein BI344_20755 [Chromobacterium sphagni]